MPWIPKPGMDEALALKAMGDGCASMRRTRGNITLIWVLLAGLLASAVACKSGESSDPPPPQADTANDEAPLPVPVPVIAEQAHIGPKVAFLGDSISAGLHLAASQAFPAVTQRKLAARGVAFELLNAGVSGDTSAGGLRRVDWILKQSPKVVVVELGGNDGLRGLPPASIEENLRGILTRIQARGAKALLLGIRIPPSYGQPYVKEFEAVFPRLARELNVAFVPFFMEGVAGVPELNLPDGLHPTAEGHERLADAISEPLAQLMAAPSASAPAP